MTPLALALGRFARAAALAAVVGAIACGGGDDDGVDLGPDAGAPDASGVECGVAPALGALGEVAGGIARIYPQSSSDPTGPRVLRGLVALDDAIPFDSLRLELYDGYGAFDGGAYAAGSFPLTGDDAAYATCGVCLLVDVDVDPSVDPPTVARTLYATAGSIEVTSVEGTLTYAATDLQLVEIGEGPSFAPVAGGCTTTIDSLSFTAAIE